MPALVYDIRPVRWAACKAIGRVWRPAFWSRLSGLRLLDVPVPELPSPQWVRLRSRLGGICGSDLAAVFQRQHPASILQAFSSLPAVLGHENVAIIDQVGSEVRDWRPGDRVVVEPTLSCVPRGIEPPCRRCAEGRFTLCENFRAGPLPVGSMIGWNDFTGGSWAPYFVAHVSQLHRVPEGITDEQAVLTDPLAGALHAALQSPPAGLRHAEAASAAPAGAQRVLIIGGGLIGMGVAASIRALAYDCRISAVVRHERQAELMHRFGAIECVRIRAREGQASRYRKVADVVAATDTSRLTVVPTKFGHQAVIGGFDVVYDCIGTGQSLTDAMKLARAGGTVVEVGTSEITLVDTAPLWFNELRVIGINGRAIETYQHRRIHTYEMVFELMLQGKLDTSGLLTHRFSLEKYKEAFAALADRSRSGAIKVAFEP